MLKRNLATTTASTVISMALSFLASIMLARLLGAELRGVYALAILIPNTTVALAAFGIPTAHIVYAGKEPGKRGAIAFQSFAFSAFVGLLTVGFFVYLLIAGPAWFERFKVIGVFNLILTSFLVFPHLTMLNLQNGILGANRIPLVNIGGVVRPLSRVLLIIVFIWLLGLGVRGGILSQLGCLVFMTVFMAIATAVKVPLRTWKPDFAFFKKSIIFGIKIYLNYIAWWVVHMVDRYMIAYLIADSDEALGQYSVAAQFATILWILPNSLQTTFLPHLSVTTSDKPILTAKTARVLVITLFPMFLAMAIAGPLIPVVVGRDYAASVRPFVAFLPGMFLYGATRPLSSYLMHAEKPMYVSVNGWIGALTNVGLNLYFIPCMGIIGAALASSLSYSLMALIILGCFIYETKLSLKQFIIRREDFRVIFGTLKTVVGKITRLKK